MGGFKEALDARWAVVNSELEQQAACGLDLILHPTPCLLETKEHALVEVTNTDRTHTDLDVGVDGSQIFAINR